MKGAESHRVPPEAAFADVYLTDEERRNVEIVDANSEYVVFYKKKSRRSVKWDRDEEGGAPDGPFLPSTGSNDTEQSSSSNENASQTKRKEQNTPPAPISSRIGYYARSALRWMMRYKAIKILQVILAFYVGFLTYADIGPPGGLRDQETGLIVDQASEERTARGLILVNGHVRPIVATTMFQVVCIGITRMSAFFMYPGKYCTCLYTHFIAPICIEFVHDIVLIDDSATVSACTCLHFKAQSNDKYPCAYSTCNVHVR